MFIWRLWRSDSWLTVKKWVGAGLFVLAVAVVIYILGWALHFIILSNPGPGDAWGVPEWKEPIVDSFFRETIKLHKTMLRANYNLSATHPDSSQWWTWPLMKISVFYWNFNNENVPDKVGSMYFIGNPMVWWGASLTLLIIFLNMILASKITLTDSSYPLGEKGWLVIIGYWLSLLPLMRVPRALFLYHYLTPLLFSILAVFLWLDRAGLIKRKSVREQPTHYWLILVVVLIGFVVISPITYGFVIDPELHSKIFWLESWR
jgi:dolichyl-phosphate-mannose--protein O-mannosyl transferase